MTLKNLFWYLYPVLVFSSIVGCTNIYEKQLKNQTVKLDSLTEELSEIDFGKIDELAFEENSDHKNTVENLRNSFRFCTAMKHSFGLSFHFSCEESLGRKPNYNDKEYFLIKLFDLNSKDNIQGIEYWSDCNSKPKELDNNWLFISRHLICD